MINPEMAFRDLLKRDDLCLNLAEDIAKEKGLSPPLSRLRKGSNIIFRLKDESILKIFSKDEVAFRDNEELFLDILHERLSVRTPELLASGEFHGYPFLQMSQLPGEPLSDVWDELDGREKESVCRQTGTLLKILHSLPAELAQDCVPEWSTFIDEQKKYLIDNHIAYGIEADRLGEISKFIRLGRPIEDTGKMVICHTEIMREHLFVTRKDTGIELSGILDFEPSMLAVPEYDFCSAGLFVTAGDGELFRQLLTAYDPSRVPEPHDIMRMLILHRYSNLRWFISMLPTEMRDSEISTLSEYWYGTS
jgi:hygromycin-B 7''-O-kinase